MDLLDYLRQELSCDRIKGLSFTQKKLKLLKLFSFLKQKGYKKKDLITQSVIDLITNSFLKPGIPDIYRDYLSNIIMYNMFAIINLLDAASVEEKPKQKLHTEDLEWSRTKEDEALHIDPSEMKDPSFDEELLAVIEDGDSSNG